MPEAAESGGGAGDAASLAALFEAKARAELEIADAKAPGSDVIPSSGAPLAQVALVKGLAGPAEAAGGAALSGADGDAAKLALSALGFDPETAFAIVSRAEPGIEAQARSDRLRLALEAVDPRVVIALDAEAAEDLALAFGVAPLRFGTPVRVLGRELVAVDGFEASLSDPPRKARIWRQLKSVRRSPASGAA